MSSEEVYGDFFIFKFKELVLEYMKTKKDTNLHFDNILELTRAMMKDPKIHEKEEKDETLKLKFKEFMHEFYKSNILNNELIPYGKITKIVFEHSGTELEFYLTSDLEKMGIQFFKDRLDKLMKDKLHISDGEFESRLKEDKYAERCFFKIIRHIDLAVVQKSEMLTMRKEEISEYKKQYQSLKKDFIKLKEEAENQSKNLKEEAENQSKSMLTQYISILGIFAAILMGAFGAIQSFTSLFNNAKDLSIGKILIVSSIGASAVLLILFLLLHSIAKLTEQSIASNRESSSYLRKYPMFAICQCQLIFISLVGAALELSNSDIRLALEGFWWALPIGWLIIIYFFMKHKGLSFNQKESSVTLQKDDQGNNNLEMP